MIEDLYQELILDHNKTPRNFGVITNASKTAQGYNPLCGDKYEVSINLDGDMIEDIKFDGQGCAISKSSGSIMTSLVKGKTLEEAKELFHTFTAMLKHEAYENLPEQLKAFEGVKNHPSRIKCANLVWHALNEAIETVGASGSDAPESESTDSAEHDPTQDEKMIKDQIIQVIMDIYDPEIPVNIYELGLIYDIQVDEQDNAKIIMTLTTPNCPVADTMPVEIKDRIKKEVDEVNDVEVEVTFDPPWTKEMMSQAAKLALGID